MKHRKLIVTIIIVVVLILVTGIILFPPIGGKMPDKKALSEKIKIMTDNGELGLMIMSDDISNPVLLVCGGGPGIPEYLMDAWYKNPFSEEFTVCYWDYSGTGISYKSSDKIEDMTKERYLSDTQAVTDYLRERFSQDKIYIMGHSFGTYIALNTVKDHPEKYVCYIAMSQIADQKQSEMIAFDAMREEYVRTGNKKMVSKFDEYDIRNSDEDFHSYTGSSLRDDAMHDLGVGTARDIDNVITGIFIPSFRVTAYTPLERINIWRSKFQAHDYPVNPGSDFNAFEEIESIDIPIYFVAGKYDLTTCTSLQEEYYSFIDAPKKKFFLFENSSHSPLYEEYDRAKEVLQEIKADN